MMNQTQSASVLALPWKLVKTIQTTTYVWVSSWPAFTVDEGLSWFNLIHSKGKPTWNSHIGSGASFDSSWWAHFSCQGWNLCGLSLAFITDWRVVGDKPLKPFDLTHYKWDRTMKNLLFPCNAMGIAFKLVGNSSTQFVSITFSCFFHVCERWIAPKFAFANQGCNFAALFIF